MNEIQGIIETLFGLAIIIGAAKILYHNFRAVLVVVLIVSFSLGAIITGNVLGAIVVLSLAILINRKWRLI